MIKKSKFLLYQLLLIMLILSGCASGRESDSVEPSDSDKYTQIEEPNELPDHEAAGQEAPDNQVEAEQETPDSQEAEEQEVPDNRNASEQDAEDNQDASEQEFWNELSDEELNNFTDFFQSRENYGFLLSDYTTPTDVDLNEVFYCGAGIATHVLLDDMEAAYEQETGWSIDLDVECLTSRQIDDLLIEKTGYSLEEMNKSLEWVYLEQYDSYIGQHGDTNYIPFACISGKRIEEDIFELKYQSVYEFQGELRCGDFHGVVTLRKNGENYLFVSNQMLDDSALSGLSLKEVSQLEFFAENKDIWNNSKYTPRAFYYAVFDLDNDGRLELITSAISGTGQYSENHFYRRNDDEIEELPQKYSGKKLESESELDFALFDYKYAYTNGKVTYYPASDLIRDGFQWSSSADGAYYLKDGTVYIDIYRSDYTLCKGDGETTCYDADGNEITQEAWEKLEENFYAGMEPITYHIFWNSIVPEELEQVSEQEIFNALAESYKNGLGR